MSSTSPRTLLIASRNYSRCVYAFYTAQTPLLTHQCLKEHESKISIALDAWTSPNKFAFLAIVAQFVNKDFELGNALSGFYSTVLTCASEEVLIKFQELHGGHTGQNLAEVVWRTLQTYEIADKV
jgi:hypothetical protein